MKLKKRKKVTRMHGRGMGSHGWGARKKHISSGNQAGFGMAGTGKTAGHRASLVHKLYGNEYFGKQGITSRGTRRRNNKVMNLNFINENIDSLKKKFADKSGVINLEGYKILGDGELKEKLTIKARTASENAKRKIEEAGGKIILTSDKAEENNKEIKPIIVKSENHSSKNSKA